MLSVRFARLDSLEDRFGWVAGVGLTFPQPQPQEIAIDGQRYSHRHL